MTRKGSAAGTRVAEELVPSVTEVDGLPGDEVDSTDLVVKMELLMKPLLSRLEGLEERLTQQEAATVVVPVEVATPVKGKRRAEKNPKKGSSGAGARRAGKSPPNDPDGQGGGDGDDPGDAGGGGVGSGDPPADGGEPPDDGDGDLGDGGGGGGDSDGDRGAEDDLNREEDAADVETADPEFSPYTKGNPYKRPLQERVVPELHDWELSETTGCLDYKIAVDSKDKSQYEIKNLHASLSFLFDACEDLAELLSVELELSISAQLVRIRNTLHGVYDLMERRRSELEVIMRARTSQATDEDKAAAEYIKQLHRGFAGGAPIRHRGVATELKTF